MAGTWIKMETNLWTDPKVVTLASRLSVTRTTVIGALHGAWSAVDEHGQDDRLMDAEPETLDRLVEIDGFARELAAVGWLTIEEGSLQFPDYQAHNGTTAKERALANKRQKRSRSRHGDVTPDRDKPVTRVEKRRKEKIQEKNPLTPLDAIAFPAGMDAEPVRRAIADWLDYRRKSGKPYKDPAEQIGRLLRQFAQGHGAEGANMFCRAVEHSIAQGYQGCYAPKEGDRGGKRIGPGQRFDPGHDGGGDPNFGKM